MAAVLILDDDFELARIWRQALQDRGHEVEICHSSSEAIALNEARGFDFYIVDLLIKVDDPTLTDSGARFIRALLGRQADTEEAKRLLGVSGFKPLGSDDTARNFFSAYGVTEFMLKPFQPSDLCDRVEAMLAS